MLDLTKDESQIFAGFRSSTKRNVKKALQQGVQIEICNSMESIEEFYRLYAITRKRFGTAIEETYCDCCLFQFWEKCELPIWSLRQEIPTFSS
jgi:lipid II:glycine glycyltransferase (peptidoglycan interpeptide bridge formation enzyme)